MSEKQPVNPSYIPPKDDDEGDEEGKPQASAPTRKLVEYQGTLMSEEEYKKMMEMKREGTWPDDRK